MFWRKLGQRGWGTNISSSVEGELQQHTDYSTLLVSPHFTVQTLHYIGRQSPVAITSLTRHTYGQLQHFTCVTIT